MNFILYVLVHRFGANTNHLVLNDHGSPVVFEGVYKIQAMLNLLHPGIFPLLPHQTVQVGSFVPHFQCRTEFCQSILSLRTEQVKKRIAVSQGTMSR